MPFGSFACLHSAKASSRLRTLVLSCERLKMLYKAFDGARLILNLTCLYNCGSARVPSVDFFLSCPAENYDGINILRGAACRNQLPFDQRSNEALNFRVVISKLVFPFGLIINQNT